MDRLGPQCAPWLLRGDRDWDNEGVISEAERRGHAYLFKLRLTKRVKRVLERAMRDTAYPSSGICHLSVQRSAAISTPIP